jgi:hypothetical protein
MIRGAEKDISALQLNKGINMKYGGFIITCECGSEYVSIIHRQKGGEEFVVLKCRECDQEEEI